MSSYRSMYLVSQRDYNLLLSPNHPSTYYRQINNVDVNDGGKVTIRNDDKVKFVNGDAGRPLPPPGGSGGPPPSGGSDGPPPSGGSGGPPPPGDNGPPQPPPMRNSSSQTYNPTTTVGTQAEPNVNHLGVQVRPDQRDNANMTDGPSVDNRGVQVQPNYQDNGNMTDHPPTNNVGSMTDSLDQASSGTSPIVPRSIDHGTSPIVPGYIDHGTSPMVPGNTDHGTSPMAPPARQFQDQASSPIQGTHTIQGIRAIPQIRQYIPPPVQPHPQLQVIQPPQGIPVANQPQVAPIVHQQPQAIPVVPQPNVNHINQPQAPQAQPLPPAPVVPQPNVNPPQAAQAPSQPQATRAQSSARTRSPRSRRRNREDDEDFMDLQKRRGPRMRDRPDYSKEIEKINRKKKAFFKKAVQISNRQYVEDVGTPPTISEVPPEPGSPPRLSLSKHLKNKGMPKGKKVWFSNKPRKSPMKHSSRVDRKRASHISKHGMLSTVKKRDGRRIMKTAQEANPSPSRALVSVNNPRSLDLENISGIQLADVIRNYNPRIIGNPPPMLKDVVASRQKPKPAKIGKLAQKYLTIARTKKISKVKNNNNNSSSSSTQNPPLRRPLTQAPSTPKPKPRGDRFGPNPPSPANRVAGKKRDIEKSPSAKLTNDSKKKKAPPKTPKPKPKPKAIQFGPTPPSPANRFAGIKREAEKSPETKLSKEAKERAKEREPKKKKE